MNRGRMVRVFFPCTGLGRQQRGFERFIRSCAAALRGEERLDITVFGGGGPDVMAGEHSVANCPRDGLAARAIAVLSRRDPYFVEQATFFAAFVPRLIAGRPDVVYFADLNLGNACWHWRRLSGQHFRLLFYNGGATTRPFTRCDLVQQVSPEHFDAAVARGEAAERQLLLPHGLDIAPTFTPPTAAERSRAREELGLPPGERLLLSVGLLDRQVKRMDYVVREVAALGAGRPHLVMAGAGSPETPSVVALARELLGDGGFTARTLPADRMPLLYRAADAFALASLREGFGLAIIEALANGLPSVVHDTPTTAWLCGPHAERRDLRVDGALAVAIRETFAAPSTEAVMVARWSWVRERFAWDRLRARYAAMLRDCAAGRVPVPAGGAA